MAARKPTRKPSRKAPASKLGAPMPAAAKVSARKAATPKTPARKAGLTLRPLRAEDLPAVVALDRQASGRSRRGFYEKRLQTALRNPESLVTRGAFAGGKLVGFAFARLLDGEFGAEQATAALDAIGVDPAHRGKGVGRALIAGLDAALKKRGVVEMQTQDVWTNTGLLGFFAAAGFRLAPRYVLERPTAEPVLF